MWTMEIHLCSMKIHPYSMEIHQPMFFLMHIVGFWNKSGTFFGNKNTFVTLFPILYAANHRSRHWSYKVGGL